jgi:hypothetical protein
VIEATARGQARSKRVNGRNIQLGYITIALLNGEQARAYIREYDADTLQARVFVRGDFIQASWNGLCWIQLQGQN